MWTPEERAYINTRRALNLSALRKERLSRAALVLAVFAAAYLLSFAFTAIEGLIYGK